MKQIGSATPGYLSPERTGESSTGSEHGKTGSLTQTSDQLLAKLAKPKEQHPAIVAREPKQNLEAAVSQLPECGLSLQIEVTGSRFPEGGGWEPIVELQFSNEDDCDWLGVEKVLNELMAPAPVDQIHEWLTIMAVETASKDEGEAVSQLRLKVLSERLQEFPGDVVRVTLHEWPMTNVFFPRAYKELHDALNVRMGNRKRIAAKLRHAIKKKTTLGLSDLPMGGDPEQQMKRNLELARKKAAIMKIPHEKDQGQ